MKNSSRRLLTNSAAFAGALAALIASLMPVAYGRKPVPPPCAADGACLPNRGEWGYYQTNWNRWPGQAEQQPTEAEDTEDQEQLRLPEGPLTPGAQEEEQRGPAEPLSEQRPSVPAESPATPPAATQPPAVAPQPGVTTPSPSPAPSGTIPDVELPPTEDDDDLFDPFGRNQPNLHPEEFATDQIQQTSVAIPNAPEATVEKTQEQVLRQQQEDAPPKLPPSLLRATANVAAGEADSARAAAPSSQPAVDGVALSQPRSLRVASTASMSATGATQPVRQAAWADDNGIRVVRSATNQADDSPAGGVQQAIYFEASDQ